MINKVLCFLNIKHMRTIDNDCQFLDFKCSICNKRMIQDYVGVWSVVGEKL